MFQGLANMTNLLRQAQQMNDRLQTVQNDLRAATVTGSAGGGMVEVRMNGLGEMLSLKVDPSLVERQERELIEDLVPAAVNQATTKARQLHADAMQSLASGLGIPGLGEALSHMAGGSQ